MLIFLALYCWHSLLKEADPQEEVCPSHLAGCFCQGQNFPSSESARNCLQLGLSSDKNEPGSIHKVMHREGNGQCCYSRKCFFHGPQLQSSANSCKGQVQLPSATGILTFPDLAIEFSVNMLLWAPSEHEWRHSMSMSRAPFQNLPRSSSVPDCAQHCC